MKIIYILGIGLTTFLMATTFFANILIGLVVGGGACMVLILLTDKDSIERSKKRRHLRAEEEKENKKWARESYHRERGKRVAESDQKKKDKYDNYNELDIRHIGHKRNKIKNIYGI